MQRLENELWQAADQLRANSKLAAAECAMPVLGLIPLRHADNRFKAFMPEIEADIPGKVPAKQREELIKLGFQGKAEPMFLLLAAGGLYLTLGDLQAGRTLSALCWSRSVLRYIRKARPNGRSRVLSQ